MKSAGPERENLPATPVIPPAPGPDARLPYHKPGKVPLRQQVSEIIAASACVTSGISWLLLATYFTAKSNSAGAGSFAMMLLTGLLVFIGDAASVSDIRPRALGYATLGSIGYILFFVIIEFARR